MEAPHGRLRDECLNETAFRSLGHARELIAEWRDDYNGRRPHTSLDGLEVKLNYDGHFSEHTEQHGGGVKIGVKF